MIEQMLATAADAKFVDGWKPVTVPGQKDFKGRYYFEKLQLKPIDISGVELGDDGTADVKVTFSVNEQQILFVKVEAPGVFEERQMEY